MVKHSLVYGIGNALNRMIGFLMIPIYTKYLIPAQYGILELLGLTTSFVGMIISLRISRAMYRFYFEYESQENKREVVSTAMLSFGIIGFSGLGAASLFSEYLAQTILDSRQYSYFFIVSFATLWLNTLVMMGYDYLQMKKRSGIFVTLSSLNLLVALSGNIYFIIYMDMGVIGVLYGNLIASAFSTLILVIPILWKVGIRFSRTKLSQMLRFGVPMVPGALANFVVLVSDRYFVKFFGSLVDTGIYSLSYKFSILPHTFITLPFFNIWSVRRLELMKVEGSQEIMGRIITYFMLVLTFTGLGISALGKDTLRIMTEPAYWDAYKYIPILILSYIVFGLFDHFVMNILIDKRTKFLSYIDLGNGAMNILLNVVLIRAYGIYGAAFATLICYTLRVIVLYIVSRRIGKVCFEFRRVMKIISSAGFVFGFCSFLDIESAFTSFAVKLGIVIMWPVVLYFFRFLNEGEIVWMRGLLANKRSLQS
jgi:O-antigen/teichoic acid export membrane protein